MPPNTEYIETELIDLLKSKESRAFSYLYDNYAAALYGIILRIINDENTANDVLQETFVKIWKHIDSYEASKGKLFTWMLNIARNTAIDTVRSSGFQNNRKVRDLDNVHTGNTNVSVSTDHIGLSKVLNHLKTEHKTLIDLAYFKGYTQEEISKELNMPLGTVKTRIRNALIHLRSILQ